jgi:hypothetical protein
VEAAAVIEAGVLEDRTADLSSDEVTSEPCMAENRLGAGKEK